MLELVLVLNMGLNTFIWSFTFWIANRKKEIRSGHCEILPPHLFTTKWRTLEIQCLNELFLWGYCLINLVSALSFANKRFVLLIKLKCILHKTWFSYAKWKCLAFFWLSTIFFLFKYKKKFKIKLWIASGRSIFSLIAFAWRVSLSYSPE